MVDIEQAIINYLPNIIGLDVVADVPEKKPDEFVSIERVGGNRDNVVIDRPTVAVQCWSISRKKAAELAYTVDDALQKITSVPNITSASRISLYNFPDPKSKKSRYQIVYGFVSR